MKTEQENKQAIFDNWQVYEELTPEEKTPMVILSGLIKPDNICPLLYRLTHAELKANSENSRLPTFLSTAITFARKEQLEHIWNNLIPQDLKTKNLRVEIFNRDTSFFNILNEEDKTPGRALWATKHGDFANIHDKYKTQECCDYAVDNFTYCNVKDADISIHHKESPLYFTPSKFLNKELCEKAVKNNGLSINLVPPHFLSEEMINEATKSYEKLSSYNPFPIYMKYSTERMFNERINEAKKAVFMNGLIADIITGLGDYYPNSELINDYSTKKEDGYWSLPIIWQLIYDNDLLNLNQEKESRQDIYEQFKGKVETYLINEESAISRPVG